MAINFFEKTYDKIDAKYSSDNSRGSNISPYQLLQLSSPRDENLSSTAKSKLRKNKNSMSPYLAGDSVHLLSRVTEKKLVYDKAANIISSFPLAINIYKASSDEFKSQRKGIKKVKKSVLTLPNVPAKIPQTCTVSDMNDSEYFNVSDDNKKFRAKKRFLAQKRKAKVRNKDYEFYDKDARYCSQMNISLDCSSTDVVNQLTGDGKKNDNNFHSLKKSQIEKEFSAQDMWTVLRNINRFQFRPSPPMSEDSIKSHKKKKIRNKKRNNRKDTRVVETCRTEEFAYISSFELNNKSHPSFSQSSSFDRITVIDKKENFSEACEELERNFVKTNNLKLKNRRHNRSTNKKVPRITARTITQRNNKLLSPMYKIHNDVNRVDLKGKNIRNHDTIEGYNHGGVVNSQGHEDEFIKNRDEGTEGFTKNIEQNKKITDTPLEHLQSGLSKVNTKDINEKILKVSSDESAQQIKGITKVILSTGNEIQKRKPRLVMAMPCSGITPKLTQADIKRRLANMRFPIVILGKEQLGTTSIEVPDYEPPQFDGLDKQIWPFMKDWYDQSTPIRKNILRNSIKTDDTLDGVSKYKQIVVPLARKNKINCEITENKLNESAINKMKNQKKYPEEPSEIIKIKTQQSKKRKPLNQIKDKMVTLLYKNNSVRSTEEQNNITRHVDKQNNISTSKTIPLDAVTKLDVSTETFIPLLSNTALIKLSLEIKKLPFSTYPWAKRKWVSDFIDTVIRRIRSGVYYNQEQVDLWKIPIDLREVSIQTTLSGKNIQVKEISKESQIDIGVNTIDCLDLVPFVEENSVNTLSGFDETLPALEVKTLNMKELLIKHCTTNVMLQFDITILSKSENKNPVLKPSFIPVTLTESHTKIFKYQTTIINAMLPAEICSILPAILKTVINSNRLSLPASYQKYHKDSNIYSISEFPRSESPEMFKYTIPTVIGLSSTLTKILNGIYTHKLNQIRKKKKTWKLRMNFSRHNIYDVLPSLQTVQQLNPSQNFIPDYIIPDSTSVMRAQPISTAFTCTALALYRAPGEHNFVVEDNTCHTTQCINVMAFDFNNLLKQIWNQNLSISFKISMPLDTFFKNNAIKINIEIEDIKTKGKTSTSIDTSKINSLYNRCFKSNGFGNKSPYADSSCKAIEYKNILSQEKTDQIGIHGFLSNTKTRKKRFVKLYKKCKSTSNISGEKTSTPLSKITNLDNFFQALGCGKVMSSVFYGHIGKKIMAAILEMKNWITEISQRQAMLILLLINKKDTPNQIRFRPVILQGIAVNRITQASELDMEIEVIERENFNKFSLYDGITYLPETIEDRDNLLEELYWIAKTTASDYQKPFNESSVKLLKSLLEKRKKLNPSYLRVMARYVGLGLLKQPGKK